MVLNDGNKTLLSHPRNSLIKRWSNSYFCEWSGPDIENGYTNGLLEIETDYLKAKKEEANVILQNKERIHLRCHF